MSDTVTMLPGFDEVPDDEQIPAALSRYYLDVGRRLEQLQNSFKTISERQCFVYHVQIRFPLADKYDYMVMVKSLTPEGALIGFNSGNSPIEALLGVGGRLRAGKFNWLTDQYPPENAKEMLADWHRDGYHVRL